MHISAMEKYIVACSQFLLPLLLGHKGVLKDRTSPPLSSVTSSSLQEETCPARSHLSADTASVNLAACLRADGTRSPPQLMLVPMQQEKKSKPHRKQLLWGFALAGQIVFSFWMEHRLLCMV